jgi:hypothetical protein
VPAGGSPVCLRASCFRFCADGTLRGGDNSVAATRVDTGWRICRGLYKELECSGPVLVRARKTMSGATECRGPFAFVRVEAGLLLSDQGDLGIYLPTWQMVGTVSWHEIVLQAVQQPV